MSKRHENYFLTLKKKYPLKKIEELEVYEDGTSLMEWTRDKNIRINNFFKKVLPSLVSKFYDQSDLFRNIELNPPYDPDNQKFLCIFDTCVFNKNFATRQTLIRHLVNIHHEEIPAGGEFLLNKKKAFLMTI